MPFSGLRRPLPNRRPCDPSCAIRVVGRDRSARCVVIPLVSQMLKAMAVRGNDNDSAASGGARAKDCATALLLLSDDRLLAECLAGALSPRGVEVRWFEDFATLMAGLIKDAPLGIILDTSRFDGTSHLPEQIRAIQSRHDARPPVAVISQAAKSSAGLKAFRAGADIFLARPFSPDELLERIHKLQGEVISGDYRILVADDDARLAQVTSMILAETGYRVERIEHPQELLAAMERIPPDILIMNWEMQGTASQEQVERLREHGQFADTPIILVSRNPSLENRMDALRSGANALLVRPFHPQELTSAVSKQIRRLQALRDQLLASRRYDLVTGLFNRDFLLESLQQTLSDGVDPGDGGVLFMEIDNPRRIHRRLSISGTDELLTQVADLIAGHAGPNDVLARFGDYSFALTVLGQSTTEILALADKVRRAAQEHVFAVSESSITITLSIGASMFDERIKDAQSMVVLSETACGIAAEAGGNLVQLRKEITQSDGEETGPKDLLASLRECLAADEFQLFFQPIVGLRNRRTGPINQVLLRMGTKQEDFQQAHDFIPLAEQMGILPELDRWVIEHTLRHLTDAGRGAPSQPQFMIVLSMDSLRKADLPDWLDKKLAQYGVSGRHFNFALRFADVEHELKLVEDQVFRLRRLGARITLTEFGNSLGAFNYLRRILVDYLRVPMGLVDKDGDELAALADKARALHKSIIVPGIEAPRHMDLAWKVGADFAQGYFIQRPQASPVFDFPDLVLDR